MTLKGARPPRPRDRPGRWLTIFFASLVIPVGLYGVIGLQAVGGWVLVVLGVISLAVWLATRPRYVTVRARRRGLAGSLLTIMVIAAAELAVVLVLASPPSGVPAATIRRADAALVAAGCLLAVRLAVAWLPAASPAALAASLRRVPWAALRARLGLAVPGAASGVWLRLRQARLTWSAPAVQAQRSPVARPPVPAPAAVRPPVPARGAQARSGPARVPATARAPAPPRVPALASPPAAAPPAGWLQQHQVLVGALLGGLTVLVIVCLVTAVIGLAVTR